MSAGEVRLRGEAGVYVAAFDTRTKETSILSSLSYDDTHSCRLCIEKGHDTFHCDGTIRGGAYSVTVSKKNQETDGTEICSGQKSFISIHSTDLPMQAQPAVPIDLTECNVEVLSIKEAFPSTSEESLNEDDSGRRSNRISKSNTNTIPKSYCPGNSKSTTNSERLRRDPDSQAGCSEFDIPRNILCVTGSNPGEPKMCYNDPPKKISKTMRKFLRNIDKHTSERCRSGDRERARAKITRGILKDHCNPECTGDALREPDAASNDQSLFSIDWTPSSYSKYSASSPERSVSFNTQVIIIHFTGDLCVGQSVETLSKEKDQQARNSELRKTFLSKYNEFWPQK